MILVQPSGGIPKATDKRGLSPRKVDISTRQEYFMKKKPKYQVSDGGFGIAEKLIYLWCPHCANTERHDFAKRVSPTLDKYWCQVCGSVNDAPSRSCFVPNRKNSSSEYASIGKKR